MTRNSDSPLFAIAQSRVAPGTELDAQGVVEVVGVNLDALLSFYEALGFRTERRTGSFAVVNGYGMRVFLAEDSNALIGPRWTNVRIVVPDVDLVWECTKSLGLPIVHMVGDRPYGLRDFVVADPSGFEIRFAQTLG
jgi:catechol 2,3-dioxygenase-like lactoylglutathione lyase family enzyme